TRIAFDVGYNSISFFNRYFRRVMNVSPREYRRFLSS
ncbi:MAG: helix-turn-helix domain-containing protein, partial [Spirochaetaceae bacterium]|nr:helix-turn-helix domain-containing protein [Spirochaetaceae bacterium]